jgi:glycosyltransferase involved in cell wall biosynthesis
VRIWAPVDTEKFSGGDYTRLRNRYGLHGRKVVTYSGRLDTLEGLELLIKAIKSVSMEFPEIVLVLAGPQRAFDRVVGKNIDYKSLAQNLGIGDKVIFTGHLPEHEVIDLLAASDILVMAKIDHPMNRVASPIKIAEYLAAGRPVISSRICELHLCLQHMENVIFCEPGNVDQLTDSINKLLSDEYLRKKLGRNAVEVARKVFDCRICSKRILDNI